MNRSLTPRTLSLIRLFVATVAVVGPLGMVTAPPPVYAQAPATPAANARQRTLGQWLPTMSRNAGVAIVADSSVSGQTISVPKEVTTPQNFEEQIAEMVKGMPAGTVWAKLYLPAPKGRAYTGDDVAAYALAQSRLFGPVGGTDTPGTVEIMGQKVPTDKADAYIAGLNLKPIYLITNPNRTTTSSFLPSPNDWANMTPDQQKQAAQAAGAQLAAMDPAMRNQFMMQHMMIVGAMMRLLPPDQRQFNITLPDGNGGGNAIIRVIGKPDQP